MKANIAHLPRLRLTPAQFFELPEYSCTYPTGTTTGKRWRRLDGAHDHSFIRRGGKPQWMIGEYGEPTPDGKSVKLIWWRPVIIVPALTVPLPTYQDLDIMHRVAERVA